MSQTQDLDGAIHLDAKSYGYQARLYRIGQRQGGFVVGKYKSNEPFSSRCKANKKMNEM